MSTSYKSVAEDHVLSEDERELKGYLQDHLVPPHLLRVQPGRGRIPTKYIYYKGKSPKGAVNKLSAMMNSASIAPPTIPYYPQMPPLTYPAPNTGFVLKPPTLVINNNRRRYINATTRAAFAPQDPGYEQLLQQLGNMNMKDGGKRRKSRRNLKKKVKKTHRRK